MYAGWASDLVRILSSSFRFARKHILATPSNLLLPVYLSSSPMIHPSTPSPIQSIAIPHPFPLEIWEMIIDSVASLGSRTSVVACRLTCRAFKTRCDHHLCLRVILALSEQDVVREVNSLPRIPFQAELGIKCDLDASQPWISSALIRLPFRLMSFCFLTFEDINLDDLHPSVYRSISLIPSCNRLILMNVTFSRLSLLERFIRLTSAKKCSIFFNDISRFPKDLLMLEGLQLSMKSQCRLGVFFGSQLRGGGKNGR